MTMEVKPICLPPHIDFHKPLPFHRWTSDIEDQAAFFLNTLYDTDPVASELRLPNLDPCKVDFIHKIYSAQETAIYKVEYEGTLYALKVYHNNGDPGYDPFSGRDLSRFRCELAAYRNLTAYRVVDTGLVLRCYGTFEDLAPEAYEPHLREFASDRYKPNAILLEYLPGAQEMSSITYSTERFDKAVQALEAVNRALVDHDDIYPRNILISSPPGCKERVVLIDFDVAIVYPNVATLDVDKCGFMVTGLTILKALGQTLKENQENAIPPYSR